MTISTVLYVTCILMALGSAAIFFVSKKCTEDEEMDGILHGIVPLIAACSYFARYVDWTFSTPRRA